MDEERWWDPFSPEYDGSLQEREMEWELDHNAGEE